MLDVADIIAIFTGANLYLLGRFLTVFKGDRAVFRFIKYSGLMIVFFSVIKIAFGYFAGG